MHSSITLYTMVYGSIIGILYMANYTTMNPYT